MLTINRCPNITTQKNEGKIVHGRGNISRGLLYNGNYFIVSDYNTCAFRTNAIARQIKKNIEGP